MQCEGITTKKINEGQYLNQWETKNILRPFVNTKK